MSDRIAEYKEKLATARKKLNATLDAAEAHTDVKVHSEDNAWTVRELAVHLALADVGHNRMIFSYSQDKEFIPADYDIERYNKKSIEKQAAMTLAQARTSLDKSRTEFIQWLDNVEDDSVLDKKGRHATLKMMTLTEIMDVMAWHETTHAADIQAVLDAQSE